MKRTSLADQLWLPLLEGRRQASAQALEALRAWRRDLAADLRIAPYLVFDDATLARLAEALPENREAFLLVRGATQTRWERFGAEVARISVAARRAGDR